MILVDSSAWIEFLRATGSPAHLTVRETLTDGQLAVTEPVIMEVLAGARDDDHAAQLESLLGLARLVPTLASDYLDAARVYRRCRQRGETVRRMVDCLIAAVAIRSGATLLHHDRDFDVIGRHSRLTLYTG